MAHEIDFSNDRANIAYTGKTPWHSFGTPMEPGMGLDVWCKKGGLGHSVIERPAMYMDETGTLHGVPDRKVLVRDDTNVALSVVGMNYRTVQPVELVEFYRSLVEKAGYTMETVGSLMGGKRIWALARTGEEARIKGQDLMRQYVLLATGYDGLMATVATQTAVRVVCQNTFSYAVGENGQRADIRIPHSAVFNADAIKSEMGLEENSWTRYIEEARVLADRKVTKREAVDYFVELFYGDDEDVDVNSTHVQKRIATMLEVYDGGVGQNTSSAAGTAWGLHNAVTRYVDHEAKSRSDTNRVNSAWFGNGGRLKNKSFDAALKLVA